MYHLCIVYISSQSKVDHLSHQSKHVMFAHVDLFWEATTRLPILSSMKQLPQGFNQLQPVPRAKHWLALVKELVANHV